ncbi:glycosyltransferase family 9 protein [bacterium]|nr:glycosyltransferase family 9 protein [bacterium]
MNANLKKILVCRTDALGDTLLTLPVCQALKQAFPQAAVDMLVAAYTSDLIENHPAVDTVIAYDKQGAHRGCRGRKKLIAILRAGHYDAALAVFPDKHISWSLLRARIPLRIGTARRWWSVLFNKKVKHSRAKAQRHEAEYNLDLVRALGVEVVLSPPKLEVLSSAEQWAKDYYQSLGRKPGDMWIGIHPGGHGSSSNWRPEQYGRLAEKLIQQYQCKILLTGSIDEQPLLHLADKACKPKLSVLETTVTLQQLAALIKQADLFIAGNTGPLHMAAALDVPVVTVFPAQGVTGPVRWGPLGRRVSVLTPPTTGDPTAVQEIRIEDVVKAVRQYIS